MQAVVLAGGFGTRLAHLVPDAPKPMAPVGGDPFLALVLQNLAKNGVRRTVLAVGYMAEAITCHFGERYADMEIVYSIETEPLLTGGALKRALAHCDAEHIFAVNGDTYFEVDLWDMACCHAHNHAELTIAVKQVEDTSRYGSVYYNGRGRVTGFEEKGGSTGGAINGGVYIISRNALNKIPASKFSFEQDYMEKYFIDSPFYVYESRGYFIDIGIPEDYRKAQEDF